MFRKAGALVLVALGLAGSICQLLDGGYALAAVTLVVALAAAIAMLLAENLKVDATAATVCTLISAFAIFHDHRAFDIKLQQANAEAFSHLANPQITHGCRSPDAAALHNAAIQACGLQRHRDAAAASRDLNEAVHLGPTSSTIVSGARALQGPTEAPATCVQLVQRLHQECPEATAGIKSSDLQLLLQDAKR